MLTCMLAQVSNTEHVQFHYTGSRCQITLVGSDEWLNQTLFFYVMMSVWAMLPLP